MEKLKYEFFFWNEDKYGNEIDSESLITDFENEETSFFTNERFSELEDTYEYWTYWTFEA